MATDAERLRRAAARYGRTLDSIAARYTNPATGKRLSGEALILKTVKGESGGRRDAVSKVGARGWAQFMPATRAGVIQKFGVDPWRSPEEAVHALTLHMRGKLGNALGLEGYNPGGGQGYVNYILGQRIGSTRGRAGGGGSRGGGGGRGGPATASAASAPGLVTTPGAAPAAPRATSPASAFQPGGLAQGLQALQLDRAPQIQTAGPQMPGMLVPKHYTPVPSMGPPQPPPELDLTAPAGQEVNFGGDLTPSPVTARGPDIVSPNQPGLAASGAASGGSSGGSGRASSGARVKGFKPGNPVIGGSVGGAHDTDGLPGYPARDYFAKPGAPAVAPVSGKVVKFSGHDPKQGAVQGAGGPLGWSVYIKGEDGRTYFLTHMGSRTVRLGQRVKAGQRIGSVANYDKYGRPSHIHMGVRG